MPVQDQFLFFKELIKMTDIKIIKFIMGKKSDSE
jgi:hypothetical protein